MKDFLIIGLGNPGQRFELTRHNLGQRAVENWCRHIHGEAQVAWHESAKGLYREANFLNITCLIPLTFMNDADRAVLAYATVHHIDHAHILIVHDDLELPLGELKMTPGGSAHGHNGVRSIHEALGTQDIARLRLGIGRPLDSSPIDDFVLSSFLPEEKPVVETILMQAQVSLNQYIVSL